MSQLSGMSGYPFGITNRALPWNDASQEWVQEQIGSINTALEEIVG